MARTSAGCTIDGCDSAHITEGMCHFGDGPHRSKGLCSCHYFRQLRGTPLEPVRGKGFAKLTAADVRQIRRMRNGGEPLRVIAARYGVSLCAISKACTRETWADVD